MRDMQSQIDEIMDYFDFVRCADAMAHLGWKWRGAEVTVPMLREAARGFLRRVYEADIVECGTGGLVASCHDGLLALRFELASWECE